MTTIVDIRRQKVKQTIRQRQPFSFLLIISLYAMYFEPVG